MGGILGKEKAPAREQQGLLAGWSWIVKPKEGPAKWEVSLQSQREDPRSGSWIEKHRKVIKDVR